ncbi:MAG: SDR family NAD(P)-dependent oxidoreductase [Bacteroidota bacterium]
MKEVKKKFGSWAIITGASSGIGKEFAYQFAASKINLVLIARRENLLEKLGDELKSKYDIEVIKLKLDLTEPSFIEKIDNEIVNLDIRLLISNAGAAHMGKYSKIPLADLESMAQLNVMAQLKLSHWFSNRLIKSEVSGGMILVSSTIAYQGTPYAANYSAAKAYILNLGEALNFELKDQNIAVSVLVPGPTDAPGLTERTDANMLESLPMKPQPVDQLVKEGLRALLKNKPSHIGGNVNRMMTRIMSMMMSRTKLSAFWGKKMEGMVYLK